MVSKIGIDKITHFAFGGMGTALIMLMFLVTGGITFGRVLLGWLISAVIIFIVSVLKELSDDTFDWYDILAAGTGSCVILVFVLLSYLF